MAIPSAAVSPLRLLLCALAASGALLTAGCSTEPLDRDTGTTGDATPGGAESGGKALAAVDELEVRGRSPKTGYSREQFGESWVDTDDNGCGTRDDILRRDLTGEVFEEGARGDCEVVRGTLDDPYTGKRLTFARGGRSEVDIDHVVALSDAWQKGAQKWSRDRRVSFANDPLNLLAVDASANRRKGDADAATWLPPSPSFRCAYVARQVVVKRKYQVRITGAEKDAMTRVLERCRDQRLPGPGRPAEGGGGGDGGGDRGDGGGGDGDGGTSYENCAAVREAGKAPIRRSDPGYGKHLDRDGDGVACDS